MDARLDVRFFAPPEDLSACFTTFYRLDVDLRMGETLCDSLQPEWANLRFFSKTPPRAWFDDGSSVDGERFQATGPSSRPVHFVIGRTRLWGIGLQPLGWARFIRSAANLVTDTIVDGEASAVFSRFAPLCASMCSEQGDDAAQFDTLVSFFRNLAPPPRDQDRILAVHQALIDPQLVHVTEFADRAGLTKRTLERLCLRHFGFTPRLLLRRQRMMRSLAAFMLSDGRNWTETIDRHYHDQAHFVHEFHAFMGMSPSEYIARPHPVISAFMAERQRIWGSPVQTLDRPK